MKLGTEFKFVLKKNQRFQTLFHTQLFMLLLINTTWVSCGNFCIPFLHFYLCNCRVTGGCVSASKMWSIRAARRARWTTSLPGISTKLSGDGCVWATASNWAPAQGMSTNMMASETQWVGFFCRCLCRCQVLFISSLLQQQWIETLIRPTILPPSLFLLFLQPHETMNL